MLAVSLAATWVFGSVRVRGHRALPDDGNLLVSTIELTHLGYVMDLAVLVSAYLLAAVLLWRRRRWGYVLATVTLVAGIVRQLTYIVALVFQARAEVPGAWR